MQERANATPTSLRKNRITSSLRLATLDRISRGLNVARNVASSSIKVPVQAALSDPTASKLKSKTGEDSRGKLSRGKVTEFTFLIFHCFNLLYVIKVSSEKDTTATAQTKATECQREVHSEGETLSDEENKESDLFSTVSRLKKVSIRKFKEWKS